MGRALGKKWNSINWSEINARVQRLQMRIAKAVVEKRWNKVKSLQWLLTHSIEAKLLAVRRVTSRKGEELLVLTMWSGILQLAR